MEKLTGKWICCLWQKVNTHNIERMLMNQEENKHNTKNKSKHFKKKRIYPVFVPNTWHRASKTLGISCDDRKCTFCYVNDETFGKHLRMEDGCQGSQSCD